MRRIFALAVVQLAALIAGCASLPSLQGRTETTAFADTAATRLGRALAADVAANPGKTGIHPLPEPHDAFAARVLLAAAAEKSLDVQYYIWHGDQVGYLFFEVLWRAAERGVRVRLLLDDLSAGGFRWSDVRPELVRLVTGKGWTLQELHPVGMSLEEVFIRVVAGEQEPHEPVPAAAEEETR